MLSKKQLENRRLKDQKPVIEAFLKWLDRQSTVKGSRLDRAVTYCQNQRPYMMTYLEDARCSLSNNISENSIRPVTCGRKNWLFSDTTVGANASMIVYSLIEMAKANGINPLKYLEYILDARPDKEMTDEELEKLSPWNDEVKKACQNNSEQNA
ncbi:MAG: transposase [Lachnospiraceae bacterium]|nr:transposase [Lachnospiraceae bacterium]